MAGNKKKTDTKKTPPKTKTTPKASGKKTENPGGKEKPKTTKRAIITTHDGHPLSEQESKFIDEYCIHGNGRQAYINAYPNSNPSNAAQNSHRLLNKDYIISEISYRVECAKEQSIADANEIMNYLSSVMRGEIKDQFGMDAPLSERTRAATELAKRIIDIPQKLANNEPPELKITLDFGRSVNNPTVSEVLGVPQLNTDTEENTEENE